MAEATPAPAEKPVTVNDLAQLAHNYQVPVSTQTLNSIAGDNPTPEKSKAFEEYLKTTAQGLYPALAPQIASGIPTAYLLDPYRQVGKNILGEHFEPDFLNDPKANAALNGSVDEKTGRPMPMTLDQWGQHLRSEPGFGWGYTNAAHDQANKLLTTLHAALGHGGN